MVVPGSGAAHLRAPPLCSAPLTAVGLARESAASSPSPEVTDVTRPPIRPAGPLPSSHLWLGLPWSLRPRLPARTRCRTRRPFRARERSQSEPDEAPRGARRRRRLRLRVLGRPRRVSVLLRLPRGTLEHRRPLRVFLWRPLRLCRPQPGRRGFATRLATRRRRQLPHRGRRPLLRRLLPRPRESVSDELPRAEVNLRARRSVAVRCSVDRRGLARYYRSAAGVRFALTQTGGALPTTSLFVDGVAHVLRLPREPTMRRRSKHARVSMGVLGQGRGRPTTGPRLLVF